MSLGKWGSPENHAWQKHGYAALAGRELYLIPGIDMLNHSSAPAARNTALQFRPAVTGGDGGAACSGAFCMAAGAQLHLLSVQPWSCYDLDSYATPNLISLQQLNTSILEVLLVLRDAEVAAFMSAYVCMRRVCTVAGCAGRAIAAGEQVLHTYGDLSDAALLQTYGFVETLPPPGNPHNHVRLFSLRKACSPPVRSAPATPMVVAAC